MWSGTLQCQRRCTSDSFITVPSLSICCPAHRSFAQVAAVLRPFREVADEIVCIVNTTPPEVAAQHLAGIADKIVFYEQSDDLSLEQLLAWMYRQCSGDWVFVVHSDEVPSSRLIRTLPKLLVADCLAHVTTRRWLLEDERHWLNEYPWEPGFQTRLLRNDPATLVFSTDVVHGGSRAIPPYRTHLDLPLWHLDNLLNTEEERAAKVKFYDEFAPVRLLHDGRPMSQVYYQAEKYHELPLADVPLEDIPTIRSVLEASRLSDDEMNVGVTCGTVPIVHADPSALRRYWAGRALGPSLYEASIELSERHLSRKRHTSPFIPGELRLFVVSVRNEGSETWDCDGRGAPLYLACRWHPVGGGSIVEGDRVALTSYVRPGDTEVLILPVRGPSYSGRFGLEIDMVHEGVRWFGRGVLLDITVE